MYRRHPTNQRHASATYANATITIAAVAAALALTLIAVSPAHAGTFNCTPSGTPGGGTGNDTLCGTSGPDFLFGQAGDDFLRGGAGIDTLDGGAGLDFLDGDQGNDILTGGPGGNSFRDEFRGDQGNDIIRARDGEVDDLSESTCGTGADRIDMDLLDVVDLGQLGGVLGLPIFALQSGCEVITIGAVNEGPNVKISGRSVTVGEDGRAAVRLSCPESLPAPCAGKLRIGSSKKNQGPPKAYSIDQGERDKVSVRLSRRDRRKLSQGDEITAIVASVEEGEFGDKTTVQTVIAHEKRHT